MSQAKLLHAKTDDTQFVKLVGHIRHTMCHELDSFIGGLLHAEGPGSMVFDLTQAEEIDSTGLGLLAKAARRALETGGSRPVIVCTDPDMRLILSSMGLEQVFDFTREPPCPAGELDQVAVCDASDLDKAGIMVEAHKSLMDLSEKNRQTFARIVEMLEKDIERKRDDA